MEHVRNKFVSCRLSTSGCSGGNITQVSLCAPAYSGLGCSYCSPDYFWFNGVRFALHAEVHLRSR